MKEVELFGKKPTTARHLEVVLEAEGQRELDGKLFPLKPMTAIFIKPGCRHRAIGKLKIVNIPIPAFDEADEWFD